MMKRIATVLIALALVLCVSGCGSTASQHKLVFIKGKTVSIDINGFSYEYIGVFCSYTNNSDEACMACDGVNVKAFQNGAELKIDVFTGTTTGGYLQCDTYVKPGDSAKVVYLFEKQDNSEVLVEFSDGQKFTFDINKTE